MLYIIVSLYNCILTINVELWEPENWTTQNQKFLKTGFLLFWFSDVLDVVNINMSIYRHIYSRLQGLSQCVCVQVVGGWRVCMCAYGGGKEGGVVTCR